MKKIITPSLLSSFVLRGTEFTDVSRSVSVFRYFVLFFNCLDCNFKDLLDTDGSFYEGKIIDSSKEFEHRIVILKTKLIRKPLLLSSFNIK